ncbi:DUF1579 domain-containing protein [Solitalea koreensis]|uniref:DUF1579 domain-containing protein n=1 Tax=Solitalea koreensis TaxID=543615 RepID=A0A521DIH1_9SPHI|nr:DUF1579 domain-containing protein [Solitalea koreensis]SMO71382.1 Protein of unknown function [Solitalea koreensis]
MKRLFIVLMAIMLVSGLKSVKAQKDSVAQAAAQKAWTEYMTPGDVHKMLAKSDGMWKSEVTMWMAPGAPPQKSTGVCTNEMILGGRYQQSKFKGDMMGMPFEGIGTLGYDNAKKIFVNSWIDNMGTGMTFTEGKWNAADKSITFTGKSFDPTTGKDCNMREVFKLIDDNTQLMEMYTTPAGGKEFKTMEIKFTR